MSEALINKLQLPKETFTNVIQIGSGAFADVYRATHIHTNSDVAIKVFNMQDESNNREMVNKEIAMHESLHHPLIVECFGHFETKNKNICMVMEYISGMTLLEKINFEQGMSEEEAQYIFVELIYAIRYLHEEKGITHRDLKLENLILDECGNIRIIDFGFGSQSPQDNPTGSDDNNSGDSENYLMKTHCGSVPYCAPELFDENGYTNEVDIWSLGVVLYSMISGNLPFYDSNMSAFINKIKFSEPSFDSRFSDSAVDLIQKMLIKDPNNRITLREIIEHPFVSKNKLFSTLFSGFERRFAALTPNLSTNDRIRSRMNFAELLKEMIEKSAAYESKSQVRAHSQFTLKPITQIGQPSVTDMLKHMPTVTLFKKPKSVPMRQFYSKVARTVRPRSVFPKLNPSNRTVTSI